MDKATAINIVKNYSDAVRNMFAVKEIFLFGSFAKDTQKEFSDLDVAIIFDGFECDYLDTSFKLNKLSRDFSLRIEPILIDSKNDPSGFLEEIKATGILIKN